MRRAAKGDGKVDESMLYSVACPSCSSKDQRKFSGELALHFPGLQGLNKPVVWAFPQILICVNCGFAAFALDNAPLQELSQGCSDDKHSDTDTLASAA